jgi:ComF family protein
MIDKILDVIFPHYCKGCGRVGSTLCERCFSNIVKNTTHSASHDFYAVGRREDVLKTLIDDYKFASERASADVLARLLDAVLPPLDPATVVVPIPTVPSHTRARGFAHAELIAKKLARRRRLDYASLLGRRTTTTQHGLKSGRARFKAASRAFYLKSRSVPANVLIVDDIKTTGATLKAARKILRAGGAENVKIAVVAYQSENRL